MSTPDNAKRAQIARVLAKHGYRADIPDIVSAGVMSTADDSSGAKSAWKYELIVDIGEAQFRTPITFAEYTAISQPLPLQALTPEDVADWTPAILAEYRRQYDERVRLPHPSILIHPDHVALWMENTK